MSKRRALHIDEVDPEEIREAIENAPRRHYEAVMRERMAREEELRREEAERYAAFVREDDARLRRAAFVVIHGGRSAKAKARAR